jgi:predicted acylesterase/phospholipase RssA
MYFKFKRTIFFILLTLQTVLTFDTFAARSEKKPLSIVFTGGSSLGAYQAGFFYQINQNLKNSNLEIKSLSGSSAGAINAFLGLYDACSKKNTNPEQSLSFNVWKQFTIANLYTHDKKQNTSLLTKKHVNALVQETKNLWSRGFPRTCDVALNFSATRVDSQIIKLNGLLLNRAEETFSIRIRGQGSGLPPLITNVISPLSSRHTNLLNFKNNDFDHNFSVLSSLISASASFPYFFSPVNIEHCEMNKRLNYDHNQTCDKQGNLENDAFFDGAIFRSSPLIYILDRANQNKTVQSQNLKHLIISSESRKSSDYFNYKKSSESFSNKFLLTYGTTANDAALYERIKNSPRTEIIKSENLIPRVGESFFGFFGFLDSSFLEFDFILGMLEADFVQDSDLKSQNLNSTLNSTVSYNSTSEILNKKACLKAVFLNKKNTCGSIRDQDFLKLVELSVGVLISECKSLKSKFQTDRINPLCSRLTSSALKYSQKPKSRESKLKYSFRQLKNSNFKFKDFPNYAPYQIPLNIRDQISIKTGQIKKNKKSPYSADIKNFERLLLLSDFYPRKSHFNILVGDVFELSYNRNWSSLNFLKSERLKFSLTLQTDNLFKGSDTNRRTSVSSLVGYEYLVSGNSLFEAHLGLRVGAKFYTKSKASDADPLVQALAAISFFEKIRFQTALEHNTNTTSQTVLFGAGLEF